MHIPQLAGLAPQELQKYLICCRLDFLLTLTFNPLALVEWVYHYAQIVAQKTGYRFY
jgi:hypothetical protein